MVFLMHWMLMPNAMAPRQAGCCDSFHAHLGGVFI
jgi:hypothetical protein